MDFLNYENGNFLPNSQPSSLTKAKQNNRRKVNYAYYQSTGIAESDEEIELNFRRKSVSSSRRKEKQNLPHFPMKRSLTTELGKTV